MGTKRAHIYALGFCILRGNASVTTIQRMMGWGYEKACAAQDWMEKNRYIAPITEIVSRKILISLKQYKLSFSDYLKGDRWFEKAYEKRLLELLENQA